MMKLFKKKKSDRQLSTTMLQQQQQKSLESSTIAPSCSSILKKPLPMLSKSEPVPRSYTPPVLVMPKPRRAFTPTRAVLSNFDNDKTQIEDEVKKESYEQGLHNITSEFISPILLPATHHEETLYQPIFVNKNAKLKQISSYSTVRSDDSSSRVYESALESLSGDLCEEEPGDLELNKLNYNKPFSDNLPLMKIFTDITTQSPDTSTPSMKKRVPVKSDRSSATITPPHTNLSISPSTLHTFLKQNEEHEILVQQLKKQMELIEQQLILDQQEWFKTKQEFINHQQQMMETLLEAKDQLMNVLKTKKENKLKEVNYQKQLQQPQQMKKQIQQVEQQEIDIPQMEYTEPFSDASSTIHQLPQQKPGYNSQKHHIIPEGYGDDMRVDNINSEEYTRFYNSRSSSRASSYPSYCQQAPLEEERRSTISRRNSNISNKSGVMINRFEPSPSTTLVALTPRKIKNRQITRSSESSKWDEIDATSVVYDIRTQQHYSNVPRRSRSSSKHSSVKFYDCYDDIENNDYSSYDYNAGDISKISYTNSDYYTQQPYTCNDLYPFPSFYSTHHPIPPFQQFNLFPNRQDRSRRYVVPLLGSYPYN